MRNQRPFPAAWNRAPAPVIVTGARSDCFGDAALPFRFGAERLRAQGVTVDYVRVSGRSSAEHNARQIAAFFAAAELPPERIVMLGYSKGAVDI
jgi:predicted esterase